MTKAFTTSTPATSVRLMEVWENGKVVETKAVKREGTQARTTQFYEGAWQTGEGTFFFVMESGVVVEADSASELTKKVIALKSPKLQRAA